ncbi:hypothetical protein Deipe_4000 (plasmid) [Deinococcus peraridilitoris DSM 19664]|uniref:Uncharacterized protein n=1 Tax=Deinococcus peraridilitoris (strain DSM 19664 / LMG 22246 / CIP 109416 / KR-200) TaxID=937777 RepID=L0A8I8_DEIPD|nr:hypothetical protein Deipe_4000 [Deinococcus peraridilitoris DSM 19664]
MSFANTRSRFRHMVFLSEDYVPFNPPTKFWSPSQNAYFGQYNTSSP